MIKKKLRRETLLTRSWEWYFYSFSPVGQVSTNTNIASIWSGKRPSIAVKIRYVWAPDGKFEGLPPDTHSIPAHVSEWLDEDRRHAGVGEGDEAEEEDEGSGDEAHPRLACYWFGIFGPDAIYILFPSISSCHNLCHSLESQVPTWSAVLFVLLWRFSGKAFQAWLIFKCSVSSKTFQRTVVIEPFDISPTCSSITAVTFIACQCCQLKQDMFKGNQSNHKLSPDSRRFCDSWALMHDLLLL